MGESIIGCEVKGVGLHTAAKFDIYDCLVVYVVDIVAALLLSRECVFS